jgi:hypothetical protein
MAKKGINPAMKPWAKFGWSCRKQAGLTNIRKKLTASQKRELKACVMRKARAAGIKVAGTKK